MTAIELCSARLATEEGFRQYPYNDATGARMSCLPGGNLTWLYGLNLETAGSVELGQLILSYLLEKLDAQLMAYVWYVTLDAARQSVCLDISYNQGIHGLLHYPHMITFMAGKEWELAAAQCTAQDPRLQSRYARLAAIMLSGTP